MHSAATRVTSDVALVAAGIAALALAGCASEPISPQDEASHNAARAAVADLSRGLYRYGTDAIDDYARWAHEDSQHGGVELIGYEGYADAVHGEPFGALQFRATVEFTQDGDPYIACFESEFDFWGVATVHNGEWDDDAPVAQDIECPPDAARVSPSVDARTVQVVPEGDIGFSMGDADECLLVKRDSTGVLVLNVPEVLLKPGELGCNPDTALQPSDQLRPPH